VNLRASVRKAVLWFWLGWTAKIKKKPAPHPFVWV
jgi:hypothetical protein